MHSTSRAGAAASAPVFKIVIVYGSLKDGIRAQETAERLGKELAQETEVNVALWKFDVLHYPSMQEQAAFDAAAADMLIISADANAMLPAQVREWLEHVLPSVKHPETQGALVALLGEDGQKRITWTPQHEVRDFLEQVARKNGMDFFIKNDGANSELSGIAPKQDLAVDTLVFLDEPFTPDVGWRRWGIND
ncbi:MAG TPA: hypothetical protein VH251_11955 [Verrucomicrobiae bacterium]|jgi:hypothetical protein|nr:hypothetical protein [Verrucomicrobiae bacterium]